MTQLSAPASFTSVSIIIAENYFERPYICSVYQVYIYGFMDDSMQFAVAVCPWPREQCPMSIADNIFKIHRAIQQDQK